MSDSGEPVLVFADVPKAPQKHFRLVLCAAAFRIAAHLRQSDSGLEDEELLDRYPVLRDYFALCHDHIPENISWEDVDAWWRWQITMWERGTRAWLPLRELRRITNTGFDGEIAIALAACVEEDPRLGALCARLQATPGSRRPTLGLVEALTDLNGVLPLSTTERLIRAGWLLVEDTSLPRSERHLRLPVGVWDVLQGRTPEIPGARVCSYHAAPRLRSLVLDPAVRLEIEQVPALLMYGRARALAVRGPDGGGRLALIRAIMRPLRRNVLVFDLESDRTPSLWSEAGPACELGRLMPVAVVRSGVGEARTLERPSAYAGPIGVILSRQGGLRGDAIADALFIDLDHPTPEARSELWRRALPAGFLAPVEQLGLSLRLTGGSIRTLARAAAAYASVRQEATLQIGDVRRALASMNRHSFEGLAQRLEPHGHWSDLQVSQPTWRELQDLELRCRQRERLPGQVGAALRGSLTRGVRALLVGPSGTGKTLAARILASELDKEIYRVDLAAVVNKYIGETEKNLEQVLTRAEDLDVVLLLDEGDALMTARTDVRTANDRYANLETNYLLQRLESYEGIILITTNAGQRIDSAFLRRIDAVIDFQPPGADERTAIWLSHLPAGHEVSDSFLHEVATRATLSGGQIRNAALFATLIALDRKAVLTDSHLELALRREYRKAGGTYPITTEPRQPQKLPPARRLDDVVAALRG